MTAWSLDPHHLTLDALCEVCGPQLWEESIRRACVNQVMIGALRLIDEETFAMTDRTPTESMVDVTIPPLDPEVQALSYAMFHGTIEPQDLYSVWVRRASTLTGEPLGEELVRMYHTHDSAYDFALRYLGYLHALGYTHSHSDTGTKLPPHTLDLWICQGKAGKAEVWIEPTSTFR